MLQSPTGRWSWKPLTRPGQTTTKSWNRCCLHWPQFGRDSKGFTKSQPFRYQNARDKQSKVKGPIWMVYDDMWLYDNWYSISTRSNWLHMIAYDYPWNISIYLYAVNTIHFYYVHIYWCIRMIIQHANRHVTWVLTEVIGNLGVADIDSRLEVRVLGMNHGVQEWKASSGDAIFVRTVDMVNIMMFLESVYIYIHIYFNTLQSCSNVFPNLISMYDPEDSLREFVRYFCAHTKW